MRPRDRASAEYACSYLQENAGSADYDGDHDKKYAAKAERAEQSLKRYQARCIEIDVAAIETGITAICQHCSCIRRDGKHDEGCFVQLHDRDLDRLVSLRDFLRGSP